VNLVIGDGVINANYLPSNTVIANITTAIEINGGDYTKLDLSANATATTGANVVANAVFLKAVLVPQTMII
jgi:hypothetical protein